MLVADACSGLHSMLSLSALGMLFIFIKGRKSLRHNAIMFASILPVAFAANVVRVIALMLITYRFGDEAGQGFLHGTAGGVQVVVTLVLRWRGQVDPPPWGRRARCGRIPEGSPRDRA